MPRKSKKSTTRILNRAPVARPPGKFSERDLALVADDMDSIPGAADTLSPSTDYSDPGRFDDFYHDMKPKDGPTKANFINLCNKVNTLEMQVEVLNRKLLDLREMISDLSVGGGQRQRGTANFGS